MARAATPRGTLDASSHDFRRPRRPRVRSLRVPASGSLIASQIRETKKIAPTTPGAMPRTSVAYFMYRMRMSEKRKLTPSPGSP